MKLNREKIQNLLKEYNVASFCRENGIKRDTISRIACPSRNCKDMEVVTAYKISKGLNISLDDFVQKFYTQEV